VRGLLLVRHGLKRLQKGLSLLQVRERISIALCDEVAVVTAAPNLFDRAFDARPENFSTFGRLRSIVAQRRVIR
jgi:hypothetical protein